MGACSSAMDAFDEEMGGNEKLENMVRDAAEIFRLIDVDRNGTISTEEFQASKRFTHFMAKLEQTGKKSPKLPSDPNRKQFLSFIHQLDEVEAVVLLEMMKKELVIEPILRNARRAFTMLDTSGDGKIDLHTEAGALSDFSGQIVLEDMDFDHSGAVELVEFIRAMRQKAEAAPVRAAILCKSLVAHLEEKGIKAPLPQVV
eukprot:CAMPEP_0174705766 /NCGR_PEP_ID=MMETSP1094-20130205/8867_1 /TAXON_ID=156173 /ORGANISM="Chrysochromulina brevifilum, Strain UTEX LB 985" /LENGTH=200 /DNA_ID=CAMNT_0015903967 /DNA_START=884 /DNA_END=1486 /DNA_ORIENTATION=+